MDTIFYKIVRPIIMILFKILYRPSIKGVENIPKEGAVVLAGNHTKWLDPLMLIASSKRQIHFLAKDELFHGFFKVIIENMGAIPVNRKKHDKEALESAIKVLNNKLVVGIFPEGTINRTEEMVMPFKIGAVKMSQETNSYLVPFVITGSYKLFRKNISIEFLKARKISAKLDLENEKLRKEISDKLILAKGVVNEKR